MSLQKIFFSYSRNDSAFALKLAKDLKQAGADVWIDQIDIPAGNHWDSTIEKALDSSIFVLLILSPSSVASANVMDEVSYALDSGKKIVPVVFVDCPPPLRLRRLQRIDFITDYEAGLEQLKQSLSLSGLSTNSTQTNESYEQQSLTTGNEVPESAIHDEWDEQLWRNARKQHTIASYKNYVNESHSNRYTAEARLLIKQLELEQKEDDQETIIWQKAKERHIKSLFQDYLHKYPKGLYKSLALAAIAEIEKIEIAKQNQKKLEDKIAARTLVQKQRNNSYVAARRRLKSYSIIAASVLICCLGIWGIMSMKPDNRDLKFWSAALLSNDTTAFLAYQHQFPTGIFYSNASQKLDSLRSLVKEECDSLQFSSVLMEGDSTLESLLTQNIDSAHQTLSEAILNNKTNPKKAPKFLLGEHHQGGLIIYLNPTGEHGLIVSMQELGNLKWEAAQKKCAAYKVEGYEDWRLPTKAELKKVYLFRNHFGNYTKGMFWSSTEEGTDMAWIQNFINGTQGVGSKESVISVRAVRSF